MKEKWEEDYIEQKKKEVPDLWDRIEPQLGERNRAKVTHRRTYARYAALAASLTLLCLCVPTVIYLTTERQQDTMFSAPSEEIKNAMDIAGNMEQECAESNMKDAVLDEIPICLENAYIISATVISTGGDTDGSNTINNDANSSSTDCFEVEYSITCDDRDMVVTGCNIPILETGKNYRLVIEGTENEYVIVEYELME